MRSMRGAFWKGPVVVGGFGRTPVNVPSALDTSLAPHDLLHGLGRRHPRPARFAPARRAGDRHLESKLIGERRRVREGFLPLGRHVDEALVHDLIREERRVEVLEAADPDSLHPLQIELDPLLRDVAVHPVPPDSRPGGTGGRPQSQPPGSPRRRGGPELGVDELRARENDGESHEPAKPRLSSRLRVGKPITARADLYDGILPILFAGPRCRYPAPSGPPPSVTLPRLAFGRRTVALVLGGTSTASSKRPSCSVQAEPTLP